MAAVLEMEKVVLSTAAALFGPVSVVSIGLLINITGPSLASVINPFLE